MIFRPHPWSRRNRDLARRVDDLLRRDRETNGRAHVFGRTAQVDLSLVDCFTGAGLLIADMSSVVPDFLYSEKPFAISAMQPGVNDADVLADFPIAGGGYVMHADGSSRPAVLDDLLHHNPKAAERRRLKTYLVQATDWAKFWAGVCAEMADRGVRDVLIDCCDALTGFPEATWPRIGPPERFASRADLNSRRRGQSQVDDVASRGCRRSKSRVGSLALLCA